MPDRCGTCNAIHNASAIINCILPGCPNKEAWQVFEQRKRTMDVDMTPIELDVEDVARARDRATRDALLEGCPAGDPCAAHPARDDPPTARVARTRACGCHITHHREGECPKPLEEQRPKMVTPPLQLAWPYVGMTEDEVRAAKERIAARPRMGTPEWCELVDARPVEPQARVVWTDGNRDEAICKAVTTMMKEGWTFAGELSSLPGARNVRLLFTKD